VRKAFKITLAIIIALILIAVCSAAIVFLDVVAYTATASETLTPTGTSAGRAIVIYDPGLSGTAKPRHTSRLRYPFECCRGQNWANRRPHRSRPRLRQSVGALKIKFKRLAVVFKVQHRKCPFAFPYSLASEVMNCNPSFSERKR
jgi:hypothetical protein